MFRAHRSLFKVIDRSFSTGIINHQSICPAGTVLNLKVKKSGKEPVLLSDEEYPEWLWTLLDKDFQRLKLEQDPIRMAKKLLRKQNIAKIKLNNFTLKLNG